MCRYVLAAFMFLLATPSFAEYRLEFEKTSFREYYCGVTLTMTNDSEETLVEINGFVASFTGDEQVGRSRGASFLNLKPGESATHIFEAPNAPCDEATSYKFLVGACRFGPSFADKEDCAALIRGIAPVQDIAGVP